MVDLIEISLKSCFSRILIGVKFMEIIALAKFKDGTMNLPKEVRKRLNLGKEGKIVFISENGKIYIEKA